VRHALPAPELSSGGDWNANKFFLLNALALVAALAARQSHICSNSSRPPSQAEALDALAQFVAGHARSQ